MLLLIEFTDANAVVRVEKFESTACCPHTTQQKTQYLVNGQPVTGQEFDRVRAALAGLAGGATGYWLLSKEA